MSTFNEQDHPRDKGGRWSSKPHTSTGVGLSEVDVAGRLNGHPSKMLADALECAIGDPRIEDRPDGAAVVVDLSNTSRFVTTVNLRGELASERFQVFDGRAAVDFHRDQYRSDAGIGLEVYCSAPAYDGDLPTLASYEPLIDPRYPVYVDGTSFGGSYYPPTIDDFQHGLSQAQRYYRQQADQTASRTDIDSDIAERWQWTIRLLNSMSGEYRLASTYRAMQAAAPVVGDPSRPLSEIDAAVLHQLAPRTPDEIVEIVTRRERLRRARQELAGRYPWEQPTQ